MTYSKPWGTSMLICYFDEVKPNPDGQPYYWLGGLAMRDSILQEVESDLSALGYECFGTYDLLPSTEFHVNRPGFRRHLAAINYGLGGGGYEHEAVHR